MGNEEKKKEKSSAQRVCLLTKEAIDLAGGEAVCGGGRACHPRMSFRWLSFRSETRDFMRRLNRLSFPSVLGDSQHIAIVNV